MTAHTACTLEARYLEANQWKINWVTEIYQEGESFPSAHRIFSFPQLEIPSSIYFTWKNAVILFIEGEKAGSKQLIPLCEDCGDVYMNTYDCIAVSKWEYVCLVPSIPAHHCGDCGCRRGTSAYHGHSADCHLLSVGIAASPTYTVPSTPCRSPEGYKKHS